MESCIAIVIGKVKAGHGNRRCKLWVSKEGES